MSRRNLTGCLIEQVTLTAMTRHEASAVVQRESALALVAMRAFPFNPLVQERACGSLCNLAFNDDNLVAAVSAGAIELIIKALAAHPSHEARRPSRAPPLFALPKF